MQKPFHENWPLTQGFGGNAADYAKFGLKGHNGLDYGLPSGTDVIAPIAGKVIEVAYDAGGYGNYIKIENDKEGSVLAHLKESLVSIGTVVTEGQLIAHSDNTGNSTGPHLHWGYYTFPRDRSNGYNGFIDQLPLLNPQAPQPTHDDQAAHDRDINWNMVLAICAALDIKVDPNDKAGSQTRAVEKVKELLKRPTSCPPAGNPLHEEVLVNIQKELNRIA